uniref:Putative transcription factor, K-box n=1 Tax=Helianthus annuus TaxID=4232 RepID=A0A251S7E1_HELAN
MRSQCYVMLILLLLFSLLEANSLSSLLTPGHMEAILERYERYSYEERQLTESELETQGRWNLESSKLRAKIEVLEKNIRNYVGEDLEPLNLRELQSIEQQLETALKRVRTRKNQAMHESISELHKKERALQEQNSALSKKLKENEMNEEQQNTQDHTISKAMLPPWLLRHMNEQYEI